jgi:tRNA (guanine-N7-)-methyltransferase
MEYKALHGNYDHVKINRTIYMEDNFYRILTIDERQEKRMRLRNIPGAKETIAKSPYVIQDPQEKKGNWKDVFASRQPLHIEVGMGKGRFIMDMAALHPDINYIGIEMYDSVLIRALQKMDERKEAGQLPRNLLFLCIDASELPFVFEKGEVEKIYLNFSDPWPKARHAKRRLTSRQFLERYDKILAKEGTIEFKTDNRDLFVFSLEEVEESKWHLLAHTFDLHQDEEMVKGNVMTEYEEKFSSMGNPIHKMIIQR